MPYLKINTNKIIPDEQQLALAKKVSELVAKMLGKPESYMMVEVNAGRTMLFNQTEEPLAYLELKSLGLPENDTSEYSRKLCTLIEAELEIDPGRIYIEFSNGQRHLWGWDKRTF
jgi:hypothetical protein